MIKVNLLRDQTAHARRMVVKPEVSRMGLVFVTVFILLLGGFGTWWYRLENQVKGLKDTRDTLQAENIRLQEVRKQINEFEKVKRLRTSRIEVIEKLKEFQTGPVLLLNHVIQSIPRDSSLWLTLLEQKADRVFIKGFASRSDSIPDFMSNLAQSGYFKTVDLELIEDDKDAARFSLVCATPRKVFAE